VKYVNLPPEYQLSRQGNQAVLEFVLPFAHPQPLTGSPIIFSVYDPTYFVDMTYKNAQQLHLPAQMPSQCQFDLFTPKPNAALQSYALSLDKADSPGVDINKTMGVCAGKLAIR